MTAEVSKPAPGGGKVHLTHGHLMALLRDMLRVRRFEDRCAELYTQEKIRGFLHLYNGEEAVTVGVCAALEPRDAVVATYREHAQALVRGTSMRAVMAEMFGKASGCSGGRGGSMHLFDREHRLYGGNAIVGGGLPVAVGLALADAMRGRDAVTACFFGDGAAAEGEFHESLNLAALWRLPVLFLCENNLYAMGTALRFSHASPDLAARAHSYGLPAESVDGMDVVAVEAAARRAVTAIRAGAGPYFLECRTYRFRAHSMFDAQLYREKAEVEEWTHRDPLPRLIDWMRTAGHLHDDDLKALEDAVATELEDAVAFAEAAEWEPVETLTRFVTSAEDRP